MGAMSTRGMAVRPFSAAQIPRRTRAATSGSHVCRSTGSDREACSGQYARRGRQSEVDRRGALASLAAAAVLSVVSPAARAEVQDDVDVKAKKVEQVLGTEIKPAAEGMALYYGFASPPTSYGGYGGNASEDPKYYFSYPENWKFETVNKVKKGMQGIDCILYEKKGKANASAFVVTFSRAGEDNKSFRLNNNVEATFQGFAGADYDLQDALTEATETTQSMRELDGETYYDYTIESPTIKYLATVTVQTGKVFALFVKAPPKVWASPQGQQLELIQSSFRTIPRNYKRSGPE